MRTNGRWSQFRYATGIHRSGRESRVPRSDAAVAGQDPLRELEVGELVDVDRGGRLFEQDGADRGAGALRDLPATALERERAGEILDGERRAERRDHAPWLLAEALGAGEERRGVLRPRVLECKQVGARVRAAAQPDPRARGARRFVRERRALDHTDRD